MKIIDQWLAPIGIGMCFGLQFAAFLAVILLTGSQQFLFLMALVIAIFGVAAAILLISVILWLYRRSEAAQASK